MSRTTGNKHRLFTVTTPYTYLLGWTNLDRWYYGVRYANGCHPNDLLDTYFTSSKIIEEMIHEHGLPDVHAIRRVFDNVEKSRVWEHTVLRRLKVIGNKRWINQTDNKSFPLISGENHHNYGRRGDLHPLYKKLRPEISEQRKRNKVWSKSSNPMHIPEQKEKSLEKRSGENHHMKRKDVKEKISGTNNWIYQKPVALEIRQQQFREMNQARKGMKYEKIPCPICKTHMPKNNFKRHIRLCEQRCS